MALSGGKNQELSEYEKGLAKPAQDRTWKETVTSLLYIGMKRLGFFGILFFASIPNPLFDLAGFTCGHFLIPFTTFFGATLLGKACIKASIQVTKTGNNHRISIYSNLMSLLTIFRHWQLY